MLSRKIVFTFLGLLSIFLIAGFASAGELSLSPADSVLSDSVTQATFNINNNNQSVTQDVTLTVADLTLLVDFSVNPSNIPLVEYGTSNSTIVSVASILGDLGDFGVYENILLSASGLTNDSRQTNTNITFSYVKEFCELGSKGGDLELSKVDIDNSGDENDEWSLLDEVEVEVKVENTGGDDIKDVMVELGLFNSDGKNVIDDLDFESRGEEVDIGRLEEDEDETVIFKFKVPSDFDEDDYYLTVKAYSDDLGEDTECISKSDDLTDDYYQEIAVEREGDEGDYVAFENIELLTSPATCGDKVTLSFDIYNIGDEDLEDKVRVNVYNKELEIELSEEMLKDLDEGDKAHFEFVFDIPLNADDKVYKLSLWADYLYDDYDGEYDTSSEETRTVDLELIGCSPADDDDDSDEIASVEAEELEEEAKAGKQVVVTTVITNEQDDTALFAISVTDYEDWAELVEISEDSLLLDAGEDAEVLLTFNINKGAEEEESFVVEVLSGDGVTEQEIVLPITESSSIFGGSSLVWIIGAINLVLIALIVIVAVKISRS